MSYLSTVGKRRTSYFVSPWSFEGMHEINILFMTSPASGGVSSSNSIYYQPILVPSTCKIYRWFWINGATVGTDNIQVGLYTDKTAGPDSVLGSGIALSAG